MNLTSVVPNYAINTCATLLFNLFTFSEALGLRFQCSFHRTFSNHLVDLLRPLALPDRPTIQSQTPVPEMLSCLASVCSLQLALPLASFRMFSQKNFVHSRFRVIAHRVFNFTLHFFCTPNFRTHSSPHYEEEDEGM